MKSSYTVKIMELKETLITAFVFVGLLITYGFNCIKRIIGRAKLIKEKDGLYAKMLLHKNAKIDGLYPSIGFISKESKIIKNGIRELQEVEILTVAVHAQPNADPKIQKINMLQINNGT